MGLEPGPLKALKTCSINISPHKCLLLQVFAYIGIALLVCSVYIFKCLLMHQIYLYGTTYKGLSKEVAFP